MFQISPYAYDIITLCVINNIIYTITTLFLFIIFLLLLLITVIEIYPYIFQSGRGQKFFENVHKLVTGAASVAATAKLYGGSGSGSDNDKDKNKDDKNKNSKNETVTTTTTTTTTTTKN